MSKKRNNKHWLKEAKHYNAPRPEPKPKTPRTRDPWKLVRKLLLGLKDGGKLMFAMGKGWRLVLASGHAFKVKRKVLVQLFRDLFIGWSRQRGLIMTVQGGALLSEIWKPA